MPFGDGTGPRGMGPMTGRGAGYCAGFNRPGFANPIPGGGRPAFGWRRPFGYRYPGARYGYGYPSYGAGFPFSYAYRYPRFPF